MANPFKKKNDPNIGLVHKELDRLQDSEHHDKAVQLVHRHRLMTLGATVDTIMSNGEAERFVLACRKELLEELRAMKTGGGK